MGKEYLIRTISVEGQDRERERGEKRSDRERGKKTEAKSSVTHPKPGSITVIYVHTVYSQTNEA
jgi:hypothetical protein